MLLQEKYLRPYQISMSGSLFSGRYSWDSKYNINYDDKVWLYVSVTIFQQCSIILLIWFEARSFYFLTYFRDF